jgi:hypothetical protein
MATLNGRVVTRHWFAYSARRERDCLEALQNDAAGGDPEASARLRDLGITAGTALRVAPASGRRVARWTVITPPFERGRLGT